MKRILLGIMVLVFCFGFVGCDMGEGDVSPTATVTPTVTVKLTATVTLTPSPTLVLTPTPTPAPRSYTTGLVYDGEYLPVLVVIENSESARPQDGLQTADVVYEVPTEVSSITRFVCVFSDNVPEEVAPVRSARMPFLYIVREWDAAFMHYGGTGSDNKDGGQPENVYSSPLYGDIEINIDGILGRYIDYYERDPDRPGYHNVIGFPQLVQSLYDYQPEPLGWLFDENSTYAGETVAEFSLSMCSSQTDYITYTYDAENDVYLRSMDGEPFVAAETNAQVTVKNIIVQYSTYTVSGGDNIKLWKMIGSGDAVFYIGGVRIEGTWEKASATDPTIYRDADGNQIVLRPGNTWIHIHPEQ